MAMTTEDLGSTEAAPDVAPVIIDGRRIAVWEAVGWFVIFFVGSFLHFVFELSGFAIVVAPFGSVNESTWEHMKLFFWPGVAFAVVEHAYLRHQVNNFWAAKATSLGLITISVIVAFYAYVGIVLPIYGKGILLGTLVTAAIGISIGQFASYQLLTRPPLAPVARPLGIAAIVLMGAMFVGFTFAPPPVFLFENFFGYVYDGQFGILADYTPYLVFK